MPSLGLGIAGYPRPSPQGPPKPYGLPGTRRVGLILAWAARGRLMGRPNPTRDRVGSGSGRVLRAGFSCLLIHELNK